MAGNSAGAKKGWAHRTRFPQTRAMISATRARLGLKGSLGGSSAVKAIRALRPSMLNKGRMRQRIAEIKAAISGSHGRAHADTLVAWSTRDFRPKESRVIQRVFRAQSRAARAMRRG